MNFPNVCFRSIAVSHQIITPTAGLRLERSLATAGVPARHSAIPDAIPAVH